jgi:hypothetical protein
VPAPAGLVGWWRAEGNGDDSVGTNNAEVPSGVAYVPAEVGLGFDLEGNTNRILVPDAPALNFSSNQDFSLEAWILPLANPGNYTDSSGEIMTVVAKRYNPDLLTALGYEMFLAGGRLSFQMDDTPNVYHNFNAGPDLRDGQFHHVAITVQRNSTNGLVFYVDGQWVEAFDPTVVPGDLTTSEPLRIGNHPIPYLAAFYHGVIDEVSLYNRALTAAEVASIYLAGSAGKCTGPVPPEITEQPSSQTVLAGGAAAFGVAVAGTGPLKYQWTFDGHNLAGATNGALTLTNLHPAQAGTYTVKISSPYGVTNSAGAVLTVVTQNLLIYKYSGLESVVAAGQESTQPYSGVMFFLPSQTNGAYVGWSNIRGKKTYWINSIAHSLWITVPGYTGQSYTLMGDAGSGYDDNNQPQFESNLIKGWNDTLSIGTGLTFAFPTTFSGANTHAYWDSATGHMKLVQATSTFTFSAADTQAANNNGQTLVDLINHQISSLKSAGFRPQ